MRDIAKILAAASVLGVTAHVAAAQTTVFVNQDLAQDQYDDLIEQIEDDAERDIDAFGNVGRPLGFDGSMALRGSYTDGTKETSDFGLGANLGYYDGANGYRLLLNYGFAETDGVEDKNQLIYGLEYTRDINDSWYGYAKVIGRDENLTGESDVFAGFGLGYKIIERPDVSWQVSFGPGYRWMESGSGVKTEEEALSLTSNYTARLSDAMLGTLDTDIVYSETDTLVYNDIGVNFSMTDALALRTSLATTYHSDPEPGTKDLENTFGISLVYSFK